jgi:SAM-dependent methyltransferase
MFGTHEAFRYLECGSCGTVQIESVPEDLARHYGGGYYSMQTRSAPPPRSRAKAGMVSMYARAHAARPESLEARLLAALLPMPNEWHDYGSYLIDAGLRSLDDPILDVGCGSHPHRLAAFRRLGFRSVLGIDPFVSGDLEFQGVPVRQIAIAQAEGQFAWIMFHHSLEHVPDPVADLTKAAALLRPGGRCLVRVPVVGGWLWRRFGLNWVEFDAPRHLHLFSAQGLGTAAARAGFRVLSSFHDSEGWEIAWSEAYEKGFAMHGATGRRLEDLYSPAQLQEFDERAEELNKLHIGGRAAFVLEKR